MALSSSSSLFHESTILRKHGERYLPQFKEKVIVYARKHSYKDTAKKFEIHHTTVSQWMRKDKGFNHNKLHSVKSPLLVQPTAEEQFRNWLENVITGTEKIEKQDLISKAQDLLKSNDTKNWLAQWVARLENKECNDKSHLVYPIWFKNAVCNFSKTHSTKDTIPLFQVSRKRINDWLKGVSQEPKVRGCKTGRAVTNKNVDEELLQWVKSEFKNDKIKGSVVRSKAKELYKSAGCNLECSKGWFAKWCRRHELVAAPRVALNSFLEDQLLEWILTKFDRQESISHAELKDQASELVRASTGREDGSVSQSWTVRFCRRHTKLLQQQPDLQETDYPVAMQQNAQTFRASLERMFFLGCMDELPLNFTTTLEGFERTFDAPLPVLALLPKCPIEQSHAALVLAALEDGKLLPPSLVLKEGAEELQDCPEVKSGLVYILSQPTAILDNTCMQQWVQNIWFRHVAIPNALIADCLEAHDDMIVRTAMAEVSCHLAVMPGGCSSLLQPLHCGGLASWFLARLQERWHQHLAMLPILDRPLAPEPRDLLNWVADLYRLAQAPPQQEMIREGFKASGLRLEPIF